MFLALSDVIDAFVVAGKHEKKRERGVLFLFVFLKFELLYFLNFTKQKHSFSHVRSSRYSPPMPNNCDCLCVL